MLEVTRLTRTYGTHTAVEDISLRVADGELVTIVGPSGCGKSTLLRCLAGLIQPTSGQVALNGVPVTRVPDRLGVVFQDYSRSLYPWMSVLDNVALPLRRTVRRRSARRAAALAALESVGLADAAGRYPWQLSGGMQQRTAIARALACDPVLLLMDEPFGSVDAQTREDLEDLVLRVRAGRSITILLVTHDIDESVYTGDRVIVLTAGPGRVRDEVMVDLPSPRDQIATKELREFARLRTEVSRLVRGGRGERGGDGELGERELGRTEPAAVPSGGLRERHMTMRAIDTHFHWFPRSLAERLLDATGYPRSERVGDGYRIHYNDGKLSTSLSAVWLDLEQGLADSAAATATVGAEAAVICTTGVITGLLDQLPAARAVPIAREYNERVAEVQAERQGTFYGTASIPLHDTDMALDMLDEAVKEFGLLGVNLPALTADGPVDNPRLEDFYGRAEELGVPLILHPGDMAFGEALSDYDNGLQLTIGRLLDTSVTVLRLIFSGVFERHPGLKVVQTHGGGLLPYQAGRIDKNTRVPGLSARPSEYLKRMYVDTVCPLELTVETAVKFYGERHVMYGTDYPCWHPAPAVKVLLNTDLSERQRELILHANAESVFSLPD